MDVEFSHAGTGSSTGVAGSGSIGWGSVGIGAGARAGFGNSSGSTTIGIDGPGRPISAAPALTASAER